MSKSAYNELAHVGTWPNLLNAAMIEVMWVGCYADDYYHDLDFYSSGHRRKLFRHSSHWASGIPLQATGHNTRTCAEACDILSLVPERNRGQKKV